MSFRRPTYPQLPTRLGQVVWNEVEGIANDMYAYPLFSPYAAHIVAIEMVVLAAGNYQMAIADWVDFSNNAVHLSHVGEVIAAPGQGIVEEELDMYIPPGYTWLIGGGDTLNGLGFAASTGIDSPAKTLSGAFPLAGPTTGFTGGSVRQPAISVRTV